MYDVEYPGPVIRGSSIHIFVFVEVVMTLKHLNTNVIGNDGIALIKLQFQILEACSMSIFQI
jgi:hypothetical protein